MNLGQVRKAECVVRSGEIRTLHSHDGATPSAALFFIFAVCGRPESAGPFPGGHRI